VRRIWSCAVVTILLGIFAATGCERGSHPGNIGKPAPQFVVSDGAQTIDLSKMRGHVVVLNFWASWCAPCVEELPSLEAMQQKMPDIKVIAVSTDQDDDVYRKFLTARNVNFPSVRDPNGHIQSLYGTVLIPETYVIDRNGILRRKFVSAQDWTSPSIMNYLRKL
jgi:cytochrome c biogenesis protein CcmG/thiol:disulfide interchange protein DsbE